MSADREHHQRVRALFERAGELPEEQRERWLRQHCEDRQLVTEVLELLALAADSGPLPPVRSPRQDGEATGPSRELIRRIEGRRAGGERYRSEAVVGRGGMGAVLRVWDDELERLLAMKVILGGEGSSPGATSTEVPPHVLERFVEEARVTGQLDHPGIVPVHELGVDADGRVFFTMRLVRGQTLREVLDALARGEGEWTQTRVVGLLLKACEALSFAHSRGVIHRDLKPANVMVGSFGEVYVMDWGLARVLNQEDSRDLRIRIPEAASTARPADDGSPLPGARDGAPLRTMDGDVVGTPAYMPPEQAEGRVEEIGPHSDVYAFGALLYHLLTGHAPYLDPGAPSDNLLLLRRVQQGSPTPLSRAAPDAQPELAAICDKAMARDGRQRYRDMAELSSDLSAYVEGRVVKAHASGAWAEARKWVQRNRPLAGALAAAVLAVVVGAVAFALKAEEASRAAELAQRNETEARGLQVRAQESERLAREETAKVLRLSDVKVLQELEDQADELWPAYPARIPDLEAWLVDARELAGNLPGHRETLAQMRIRALPWSDEQRARDRRTHPRAGELAEKRTELEDLIAQLEQGLEGEALETADRRVTELELELAELASEVESRRTWRFASPEDQWQHDVLVELIAGLEELEAGLLAEDQITSDHGWSVPKRLGFARELQAGFAVGGPYAEVWAEALALIRQTYPGLDLEPQVGLLPIGPDPRSGLWEFAHLMTGTPAQRGRDGELTLTEDTGVVLVLLPGGSFWMGAQSSGPNGRNYDPQALEEESPVHQVALSAYFLSKYELTQGQWKRLTGLNPSNYGPDGFWNDGWLSSRAPVSLLHPVEQVSWQDCMTWLPKGGLALPSEAQWEYGARAGTDTTWWTGMEKETLSGATNLVDLHARGHGGSQWVGHELWLDDGATAHARVGTYRPNAFGLHEVVGNLWEWCLDGYEDAFYERSPDLDPVAPWEDSPFRVTRGGSFALASSRARSAHRDRRPPARAGTNLGVRPARSVNP